MSHWHDAVIEWAARRNARLPDSQQLTMQQACIEARSLMAQLRKKVVERRRVVVPELGTFVVKKLRPRKLPTGATAGETWHIGFHAGPRSRGKS